MLVIDEDQEIIKQLLLDEIRNLEHQARLHGREISPKHDRLQKILDKLNKNQE